MDGDDDLGARLRFFREKNGLSQRKLAQRSGATAASISLIEAGRSSPSVAILRRILAGIPVSLTEFFSTEIHDQRSVVFRKEEMRDIGRNGVVLRAPAIQRRGRAMQLLHEFYDPGKGTGRANMSHDGEECGVVVGGTLRLVVDGRTYILRRGDAYYFDSHLPHSFSAIGGETLEIVSTCTPASF